MALFAHQAVYLNIIDVPNDVIIVRLWRHETSSCSCNLWFHRMWAWIYVTSWIFILLMSDFNYMDNLCIILLFQHYSLTARTTFIPGTVWTSLFCLRDDLNISCLSQGRLEPGWPEGTDPDPRGPVVQQGEALQGECINKGTVHRNQGNLWTN